MSAVRTRQQCAMFTSHSQEAQAPSRYTISLKTTILIQGVEKGHQESLGFVFRVGFDLFTGFPVFLLSFLTSHLPQIAFWDVDAYKHTYREEFITASIKSIILILILKHTNLLNENSISVSIYPNSGIGIRPGIRKWASHQPEYLPSGLTGKKVCVRVCASQIRSDQVVYAENIYGFREY